MLYPSRVLFPILFITIASGCVSNPPEPQKVIKTTTTTITTVKVEEKEIDKSEPVNTVIIYKTKPTNNITDSESNSAKNESVIIIQETIIIEREDETTNKANISKPVVEDGRPEKLQGSKIITDKDEDFNDL